MARAKTATDQLGLFGSAAPAKALSEPPCEFCACVGSFGFYPPRDMIPPAGSGRFYCGAHRALGEATWRETYGLSAA